MARKKKSECCAVSPDSMVGCCRVEAVISVDERGQMVLPKETREKASIFPGDKLALASWERGDKVCCLFLIKAEELAGMVKNMLGPIAKDILQ